MPYRRSKRRFKARRRRLAYKRNRLKAEVKDTAVEFGDFENGVDGQYLNMPKWNATAPDYSRDCWTHNHYVVPPISRGTAPNQRIGSKVRMLSIYFHYRITLKPRLNDTLQYGTDCNPFKTLWYQNNPDTDNTAKLFPVHVYPDKYVNRSWPEETQEADVDYKISGNIDGTITGGAGPYTVNEDVSLGMTPTVNTQGKIPLSLKVPYSYKIRVRVYAVPARWSYDDNVLKWFIWSASNKRFRAAGAFADDTPHWMSNIFWEKNDNQITNDASSGMDPTVGGIINANMWRDCKCIYSRTHSAARYHNVRKLIKFGYNIKYMDSDSGGSISNIERGYMFIVSVGCDLPYSIGSQLDMTPYYTDRMKFFYVDV